MDVNDQKKGFKRHNDVIVLETLLKNNREPDRKNGGEQIEKILLNCKMNDTGTSVTATGSVYSSVLSEKASVIGKCYEWPEKRCRWQRDKDEMTTKWTCSYRGRKSQTCDYKKKQKKKHLLFSRYCSYPLVRFQKRKSLSIISYD